MRIGKLDRRATLQRRVLTPNTQNEQVESWTDYATVWAEKLDLRGREFYAANQEQGEVTTKFRIRYRSDVLMTDRIVCDGLTYDITSIAEVGRRQVLELLADAHRD